MRSFTDSDVARFRSKVDRSGGPQACWLWTAGVDDDGYGAFYIWGRNRGAHRVSVRLTTKRDIDGLHVLHTCDNPPCVNPAHLRVGTHAENMADMIAKGRSGQTGARLSPSDVDAIRKLRSEGFTVVSLAERFGVSRTSINNILSGRTWAKSHTPLPRRRGNVKLSDAAVCAIREAARAGWKQSDIAKAHSVSPGTISRIVNGLARRDVRKEGTQSNGWTPVPAFREHGGKLNADAVRTIRRAKANGDPQVAIARSLGVSQATVSRVLSGERWGHVQNEACSDA